MDLPSGPEMPAPKYCSVTTTLKAPFWDSTASPWDLAFTCPFAFRAPCLSRYVSYYPHLHIVDPAWQGPGWLGRLGGAVGTWVLARREPDGFYYRAQIKAAPELERQGTMLVEFEVPLVTDPKQSSQQHSVVLEEEVVPLSPPMAYILQPGDKVLAPWEPKGQRYGPGTVLLGLKIRDPQRESKDEKMTIHFWNGKTTKVPIGEAIWVPPAIWKMAVERLHKPFTMEHPSPLLWAPCCSLLEPVTGCVTNGFPLGTPFLCPPCYPHACCQLLCQGCLCCCPSAGTTWWPLNCTSEVTARELPEPTTQLLPLEGPKENEVAVQAPMVSSSSSSSSQEDLGNDQDIGHPQRLMVDSTVNTDPTLLEKSPGQSGICQPEWRYWRRNGPEPCPRKPSIPGAQGTLLTPGLMLAAPYPTMWLPGI